MPDRSNVIAKIGAYECSLVDDELRIAREESVIAVLPLIPVTERPLSFEEWRLEPDTGGGDVWSVRLPELDGRVILEVRPDGISYAIETSVDFFESITYFPNASITSDFWQTFQFLEHDRLWSADQNTTVDIGSSIEQAVTGPDHGGLLDPADIADNWLPSVPPRVASFRIDRDEWLGLSVPGPLPVAATRFIWRDGRFSLEFEHLRPGCEGGEMPRVHLVFGLSEAEDVLTAHAELTRAMGLYREHDDDPGWWGQPSWGLLDEMLTVDDPDKSDMSVQPPEVRPLTPELIKKWARRVEEITGVGEFLIVFDQVYFARYGEYEPIPPLGGTAGFRQLIQDLRDNGKRVGLYFNPSTVDIETPALRENPEWFADRLGEGDSHRGIPPTRPDMECKSIDWTHPGARKYMEGRVHYLLSDDPDCLGADWLCVHNTRTTDPRGYKLHDPDWGVGDLATHKLRAVIYQAAKRAKPDAMVRFITVDSSAQPYVDRAYINEDWTPTCDNWWRMARIVTRTLPGTLLDVCPWFVSMTKAKDFWMVAPAFGVACNYALSCFVGMGRAAHRFRPTREKDRRRWAASWQAYVNAPMTADQRRRLNYRPGLDIREGEVDAWRKYVSGPLAGFYAARTFGRRCYATFSTSEARLVSTEDRWVNLPLPAGAGGLEVQEVRHDGTERDWPYEKCEIPEQPGEAASKGVRLLAKDCGGEGLYYRVRYTLLDSPIADE